MVSNSQQRSCRDLKGRVSDGPDVLAHHLNHHISAFRILPNHQHRGKMDNGAISKNKQKGMIDKKSIEPNHACARSFSSCVYRDRLPVA